MKILFLNYQQIIQSIKKKEFAPVYFLQGEEVFFIDSISSLIESTVLEPEEKDFNQVLLYGKEVEFKQVVDQARQFPLMAPYRVVILREAQEMKDIAELHSYVLKPSDKTILVINYKYKRIRKNTVLGKAIASNATILDAKKLYDNQVPTWIMNHSQSIGLKVKPEAAELILELMGADLSKIAKELEKLQVVMGDKKEVDIKLVNQYIGWSKDYNVFELNNALGKHDVVKTGRIIQYFIANPKSAYPPNVIGSLTNYFAKVLIVQENLRKSDMELAKLLKMSTAFFIKDYKAAAKIYQRNKLFQIFNLLEQYDLRLKGVDNRSTNPGELMKELVFKILH